MKGLNSEIIEKLIKEIQLSLQKKDWQRITEIDKVISFYLKKSIKNKNYLIPLIKEYNKARKICIKELNSLKKNIADLNNNYSVQKYYNLQESIK